jgi:hypothetical protein
MVSAVTPSKIDHFILYWASFPCPSKGVHKKHHLTAKPSFFGGDTAFLTSGGNSMWIVLEPSMVLAITSSKIVHFILYWTSLPCPSKGVHKKHHLTA